MKVTSWMTYTVCTSCGRSIPYDQPRVRLQFVTGDKLTTWKEVCIRWCAAKVLK